MHRLPNIGKPPPSKPLLLGVIVLVALIVGGCRPKYPKCERDSHCKKTEYCVNKLCQQCRDSRDCAKGRYCNAGRCDPIVGYCEGDNDCPDGLPCINNRCAAPCEGDSDCNGGKCCDGKCLKDEGACCKDEDCPENSECQQNRCVAPPSDNGDGDVGEKCVPPTVYFGFNSHTLSSEATSALQQAASCIQSVADRRVRVEGHCDPRGTEEYNLALGDRRARAVVKYLTRLGISGSRMRPVSKGELEAQGTNQATYASDRKVQFGWE